ncbi:MAG TPA: RteC domain-containing protein [Candidatus Babeliaceae bacterium]|nr:RteC domain-containing protein [Candidatus Babeliaceae bacterium]
MKEYIRTLYDEMLEELRFFDRADITSVKRLTSKLNVVVNSMDVLKQYLETDPFANVQEEISFFKYGKPLFSCEQYYAQHFFNLETKRRQLGEASLVRSYYEQELTFTRYFFTQHQFLYHYFQVEATEMDSLLFRRGAETSPVILPETPDLDPRFSTKGDYIFAKFITYERIQEYLTAELYPETEREQFKRKLNWTGDKMNLIEIAYGIFDTAQINNGDIDIKDIIQWLEDSLNISLTRHYRLFNEMKDRKLVSKTRYLDHASAMVQDHLNKGDEFRPQAPRFSTNSKSAKKK